MSRDGKMVTSQRLCSSAALLVVALSTADCVAFSTVRSAQVDPGPSVTVQASYAAPPGETAGWFWYPGDCFFHCSQPVIGPDLVFAYGFRPSDARAGALGVGFNGVFPYAEAYGQLAQSRTLPAGIGARIGEADGWGMGQFYGRVDYVIDKNRRLLWNPGVFLQGDLRSNPRGSFLGLVQGVGLEDRVGSIVLVPSVGIVFGHAQRNAGPGWSGGPETRAFGTAALSITFGRKRE